MAVGIAHHQPLAEPERTVRERRHAGRDDGAARLANDLCGRIGVHAREVDLPVPEVARAGIGGERTAIVRRQVLEELDPRPVRRAQGGDPETRAEDIVQPLLFGPKFSLAPATSKPSASR